MKIVNDGVLENGDIILSKMTIEYMQDLDCCQSAKDFQEDYQVLTVTTDDGGGGKFLRINTGEAGWSIGDISELTDVLNDFKQRLEFE